MIIITIMITNEVVIAEAICKEPKENELAIADRFKETIKNLPNMNGLIVENDRPTMKHDTD